VILTIQIHRHLDPGVAVNIARNTGSISVPVAGRSVRA